MREAVFSSVVSWFGTGDQVADESLSGLSFLDLFAGSGALGLEALSSGAANVTFVENATEAVQAIQQNMDNPGDDPRADVR